MPRIKIESTTSSPVLDFATRETFHLTVTLTLDHTGPITLCNKYLGFLNIKIMGRGGLSFTDVATGEAAYRPAVMLLYLFTNEFFEKDPKRFTTLHPGVPHVLRVKMKCHRIMETVPNTWIMTSEEREAYNRAHSDEPPVYRELYKWSNTKGLKDGVTYRVGTDQTELDDDWIEGTTEELMALGEDDILKLIKKEVIPFDYVDMAEFSVKRPDDDDHLSFPELVPLNYIKDIDN